MDLQNAYNIFQADQSAEDEGLLLQYQILCEEQPDRADEYRGALMVLAQERDSRLLSDHLRNTRAILRAPPEPPQRINEPRGLNNIGNTCYLNSLLQYLYTIKPLRELVCNFDKYKQDLDEQSIYEKQIGQESVSLAKVKRAQECRYDIVTRAYRLTYCSCA